MARRINIRSKTGERDFLSVSGKSGAGVAYWVIDIEVSSTVMSRFACHQHIMRFIPSGSIDLVSFF